MQNSLFVISGPSGVGKGTLVKALLEEDPTLALSISCTTRAPRAGERHGVEYFFLTREEFDKRRESGDFLEYDEHFGNYYGTPRSWVVSALNERSVILEIDVVGGIHVRDGEREKGEAGVPVVLIMIAPPDMESLEKRLAHRGAESAEQLKSRRARVEMELSTGRQYDYIVVNDQVETCANTILNIIAEKAN